MKQVISKVVECPWCGAEPGQECTEMRDGRIQSLPYGRGHLARVETVEDEAG